MSKITLNAPHAERKTFNINFLDSVVAELRYPTYLSLETESPTEISKAWRQKFPVYSVAYNTNVTPMGISQPTPTHQFRDRKNRWIVSLSPHNMSISTSKYSDFEELLELILFMSDTALPILETDFYTRVGLRYVNKIHVDNSTPALERSVNSELAGLSKSGVLGAVSNLRTEVQGNLSDKGTYLFRYGISNDPKASTPQTSKNAVILDFDYMEENVDANDLSDLYNSFHDQHFPFFWWTLGEETRKTLEEAK